MNAILAKFKLLSFQISILDYALAIRKIAVETRDGSVTGRAPNQQVTGQPNITGVRLRGERRYGSEKQQGHGWRGEDFPSGRRD